MDNEGFEELSSAVDELGEGVLAYKQRTEEEVASLRDRIEEVEAVNQAGGESYIADTDKKAVATWMREGTRGQLQAGEIKSLSLGSGSDILAPEVIAREIEKFAKESSGLVQRVKQTRSSSGDYHRVARVNVPTAAWSSETGTRSDSTDILYRDRAPTGGELYYVWPITNWLLNDTQFDLSSEFLQEAGQGFGRALENAILNGTGSNQPTGTINTTPDSTADFASPLRNADTIQGISTPSPDSIVDHMLNTLFTLNSAYRQRAIWVMNSTTLATVRKAKDSQNQPVFQTTFAAGVDAGEGSLFGREVVVSEFMPDLGASPAVASILVGDFTAGFELVRIGQGSGFTLIRDQVTVKGQTKFYIAARYLGRPIINDAVKAVMR